MRSPGFPLATPFQGTLKYSGAYVRLAGCLHFNRIVKRIFAICEVDFLLVTIKNDSTRSLRTKQSDGKYVRFFYSETSFILHEKMKISLL